MYAIEITDDTTSAVLPILNIPLTEGRLEGATDVTTLDMNIYTDFIANKRVWSHQWDYMSEEDFNTLKGFYDRQFSLFAYPRITISKLGITDATVRMTLSPQNIIDNCGTVEGVGVSFRETNPIGV